MAIELRILEVQSCCWRISLRTGTKIFGFISLVGGLLLAVMSVATSCLSYLSFLLSINYEGYEMVVAEVVLELVLQLIHLVTSFFLLLGVYQENSKLIPPWLVTTVLVAVLQVFLVPSSILSQVIMKFTYEFYNPSVFLIILDLLDEIYGFLVVYSYYRSLPLMDTNPV